MDQEIQDPAADPAVAADETPEEEATEPTGMEMPAGEVEPSM